MVKKLVVLSKRLANTNSKRTEKKLLKIVSWANPLIEISEEIGIELDIEEEDSLNNAVEKLKEFAKENEYELDIME